MPLPLAAMAIGAGINLGIQLLSDLMSSGDGPEKVAKAKDAQAAMVSDLVRQGMSQEEAMSVSRDAIGSALETGDPSTAMDYVFAAVSGAALGGVGSYAMKGGSKLLGKVLPKAVKPASATTTASQSAPNASVVGQVADDVYQPGFIDPQVAARQSAMRMGAADSVSGVKAGGNIGYTPQAVATRGGTMRSATAGEIPFPAKGRGDFNVEVIGDSGVVRSPSVAVEGPAPKMAMGGEGIALEQRAALPFSRRAAEYRIEQAMREGQPLPPDLAALLSSMRG